ncbi:hypothetical protein ACLOJK_037225, partial [Asimina triloba]
MTLGILPIRSLIRPYARGGSSLKSTIPLTSLSQCLRSPFIYSSPLAENGLISLASTPPNGSSVSLVR